MIERVDATANALALLETAERAKTYARNARASSTRRAYASDWVDLDKGVLQARRLAANEAISRAELERKRVWKLNAEGLLPDVHLARRLADVDSEVQSLKTTTAELDVESQHVDFNREEAERARTLILDAAGLWGSADAQDQAAAARALARALSGLCVLEDGALRVGPPTEWNRFLSQ